MSLFLESVALCAQAGSWLELASWGLKRELGPLLLNAGLQTGTPHRGPRLVLNCWSVFNFPRKIRLNIRVIKSPGLQIAVSKGLAGCRLKVPWQLRRMRSSEGKVRSLAL